MALCPALALANVPGRLLGRRLALRHGAGFVRVVLVGVAGALILKTGFEAFTRRLAWSSFALTPGPGWPVD